ncbi:hypothetical protein ABFB09_08735 [Dehalogenimonas sp. THU2]|uniref:hypothetical protein n=1 Tax=Dehalogenimonas sp. THU2 TaxID=3151121 RepID=UPI0032187EE3
MGKTGPTRSKNGFFGFLTGQPVFLRSIYAETLLENFFVSAVASVLAIRLYLQATGFPQLGVGPLHIAHMLWGGLLMLIALAILLAFLDHRAKVIAAVVGGIGFGAFIDELGKFITKDNDYFFQPAIALIYIVFVLIFFGIRAIGRRRSLSSDECLANIFDIAKRGSLAGLDEEEQGEALELLDGCEATPVRDNLAAILRNTQVSVSRPPRPLARFHATLDRFYEWAAGRWWFSGIIITFFAFTAVTSVAAVVAVVEWSTGLIMWLAAGVIILLALLWSSHIKTRYLNILIFISIVIVSILISWAILGNLKGLPLTIIDWAQLISPGVSGILIALGIFTLPRSRLRAYQIFRWAILVSIFLTQVLSFYEQQLFAVLGLVLDVLILVALRYMIAHEHIRREKRESGSLSTGMKVNPD